MQCYKPRTKLQREKFKSIVKAHKGQLDYKREIKHWNQYAYHSQWYWTSPQKHQQHINSSARWERRKENKATTKAYRLHSYFKNFVTKWAFAEDFGQMFSWIRERYNELTHSDKRVYFNRAKHHRLPRNSDVAAKYEHTDKGKRMHHQYRSHAHKYIMNFTDPKALLRAKKYILRIKNQKMKEL